MLDRRLRCARLAQRADRLWARPWAGAESVRKPVEVHLRVPLSML